MFTSDCQSKGAFRRQNSADGDFFLIKVSEAVNPNIDFLGICQLLKALRTVGFSENEIRKIARRIAVELGANFTLYA